MDYIHGTDSMWVQSEWSVFDNDLILYFICQSYQIHSSNIKNVVFFMAISPRLNVLVIYRVAAFDARSHCEILSVYF